MGLKASRSYDQKNYQYLESSRNCTELKKDEKFFPLDYILGFLLVKYTIEKLCYFNCMYCCVSSSYKNDLGRNTYIIVTV